MRPGLESVLGSHLSWPHGGWVSLGELSAALNLIQDMQRAHEIMRVELSAGRGRGRYLFTTVPTAQLLSYRPADHWWLRREVGAANTHGGAA